MASDRTCTHPGVLSGQAPAGAGPVGAEYFTGRWTITAGPRMTRAGLLDWALGQLPERAGKDATVLFFTAEPSTLPVCR